MQEVLIDSAPFLSFSTISITISDQVFPKSKILEQLYDSSLDLSTIILCHIVIKTVSDKKLLIQDQDDCKDMS